MDTEKISANNVQVFFTIFSSKYIESTITEIDEVMINFWFMYCFYILYPHVGVNIKK